MNDPLRPLPYWQQPPYPSTDKALDYPCSLNRAIARGHIKVVRFRDRLFIDPIWIKSRFANYCDFPAYRGTTGADECLLSPDGFRQGLCEHYAPEPLARELAAAGLLVKNEPDHLTSKRHVWRLAKNQYDPEGCMRSGYLPRNPVWERVYIRVFVLRLPPERIEYFEQREQRQWQQRQTPGQPENLGQSPVSPTGTATSGCATSGPATGYGGTVVPKVQ